MNLTGCGTALVTPFRPDGSLDEPALESLIHRQILHGVELLIPCGTTGEASTLTEPEWLRVIEITCATAAARVPVFAGCTHNSTQSAIDRARTLGKVPGLTGILTANPYYNRPSQEGQYRHFRAIAEATDLAILLYNIPSRTGANLNPETVLRLAEVGNIIGIKESSGNLTQITDLLVRAPETFQVFCGDDALALPLMALGAAGLISVASNVAPAQVSAMIRATLRNDWPMARGLNAQLFPLVQALFAEPSPAPAKACLALQGHGGDILRLPMLPVTDTLRAHLQTLLASLNL